MEIPVDKIASLAQQALGQTPQVLAVPQSTTPVILHQGKVLDLEKLLETPVRKRGNFTISDVHDFCRYVNAHKVLGTQMWADLDSSEIRAVIDGHEPEQGETAGAPGWGEHVVTLCLGEDPDWEKIKDANGRTYSQDQFAALIEELSHVIVDPVAADLRELVLKFQATQVKTYERPVFDEASGSIRVSYTDETEQKGQLKLPEKLWFSVAMFKSAPSQSVEAKVFFRFGTAGVNFGIRVIRPDLLEQTAFEEVVAKVTNGTSIAPYNI